MYDEILKIASSQGIWTVLSCFLLIYIIKAQEKRDQKQEIREENYQNIIEDLTNKLIVLDNINSKLDIILKIKKDKKNIL
ncbi:MAG: BhlA/UviB family holin-like peptide [Clostridium butyricum]